MRIPDPHGRDGLSCGRHVWVAIDAHGWLGRLSLQFQNGKVANKLIAAHVHKFWMLHHGCYRKLLEIVLDRNTITVNHTIIIVIIVQVLKTVHAHTRLHIAASTGFDVTGRQDNIGSNQGATAVMIQRAKVGITALDSRMAVNNEFSTTATLPLPLIRTASTGTATLIIVIMGIL
jgi:hypothetical protein